MAESVIFYLFGGVAVIAALFMVTRHNPVSCAMSLVVVMFCLAVLFLGLHAPFVAMMQVIVYAGAVMVLFLYVIMLLNLSDEELGRTIVTPLKLFGGLVGCLFLVALVVLVQGDYGEGGAVNPSFGGVAQIGKELFSSYMLPFEIASVLLLAAIVGAVVIAQREQK